MLGLMFGGQPLEECRSEAAETVGEAPEADSGRMASISLDSYEKIRSEKGLLLVFDFARSNWMELIERAEIPEKVQIKKTYLSTKVGEEK